MSDNFSHRTHGAVLASTLAGSWYPASAGELRTVIDRNLSSLPPLQQPVQQRNLLILPHAGYVYSLPTAIYGIQAIMGQSFKRVLLLAPSHRAWLPNQLAVPDAGAVKTPLGDIPLDTEGIQELARNVPVVFSNSIHQQEHAAQIQYPLLQFALKDFRLLPVIVGSLESKSLNQAAKALSPLWDADTLLVVSSDFTHYGEDFQFAPFPDDPEESVRQLDLGAFELLQKQDCQGFLSYLERSGATICGQYPLALMLSMLKGEAGLTLLHYGNSLSGNQKEDRFVCYLAAAGWDERPASTSNSCRLNRQDRMLLLSFARRAIEYVFQNRQPCPPDEFAAETTPAIRQEMACFVTLTTRSSGHLRGCIGEITAFRPLYQSVTARAVDAAFRDHRFMPLTEAEFADLAIEISALTPPEKVSSWRDIQIGRHGMTLTLRGRSAVFLPQVAPEQGWDLETTLTELSRKAGLQGNAWQNPEAKFTVFEAIVFSEDSPDGPC